MVNILLEICDYKLMGWFCGLLQNYSMELGQSALLYTQIRVMSVFQQCPLLPVARVFRCSAPMTQLGDKEFILNCISTYA